VAAMGDGESIRSPRDILSNALFCKFDLAVLTAPLTCSEYCRRAVCRNDRLLQRLFRISSNTTPKTDHCCVFPLYYSIVMWTKWQVKESTSRPTLGKSFGR
jgi:hypothetical protein